MNEVLETIIYALLVIALIGTIAFVWALVRRVIRILDSIIDDT